MYFAFAQVPMTMMRLAVRTQGDPAALTAPIRNLLRGRDANIPLAEPATMLAILDDAIAEHRVITASLGLFSS